MTQIPYFTKFLRRNSSQMTMCLKQSHPWAHFWLPNSDEGRIIFHRGLLASDATVDVLINPQSGWWNMSLIDQCFYLPDAYLIKSLPLCTTPQPDSLI